VLLASDMMIEFMLEYNMERQEWWSIIMTSLEAPEAHAASPRPIWTLLDLGERRKWMPACRIYIP